MIADEANYTLKKLQYNQLVFPAIAALVIVLTGFVIRRHCGNIEGFLTIAALIGVFLWGG